MIDEVSVPDRCFVGSGERERQGPSMKTRASKILSTLLVAIALHQQARRLPRKLRQSGIIEEVVVLR